MKQVLFAIAMLALLAAPASAQKAAVAPTPDEIIRFEAQDVAMNAAIEEARRTYPLFLTNFDAAPANVQPDYMIKVGLPTPSGGNEHIWVEGLHREGGRLVGVLSNEPVELPGMHRGSPVEIDHELLSDWAIIRPEGMYGSFTTRVMLAHMDAETAAQMRQVLTPFPLPADWAT